MTEAEYRVFLAFVFERYVRPRLPLVQSRHHHHFERDRFCYELDRAVRSAQLLPFLESYCEDDEEAHRVFTVERLQIVVTEAPLCLEVSADFAEESGFVDACEAHLEEIPEGLAPMHLPPADLDVLREIGSPNPDMELRSLVFQAKRRSRRADCNSNGTGIRREFGYARDRLKAANTDFHRIRTTPDKGTLVDIPRKQRRSFKGLGRMSQGAALSIANVALAIGALKFPVSRKTPNWDAMASAVTGSGTVLNGIGDLLNGQIQNLELGSVGRVPTATADDYSPLPQR